LLEGSRFFATKVQLTMSQLYLEATDDNNRYPEKVK